MSRVETQKPSPFDWCWIEEIIRDNGKPRQQDIDRAIRFNGFIPKSVKEYMSRPRGPGRSTDLRFVSTQKDLAKPYVAACWDIGWLMRCRRVCTRIAHRKMSVEKAIVDVAANNKSICLDELRSDWDAFVWSYLLRKESDQLDREELEKWASFREKDIVNFVSSSTGVSFEQIQQHYKKSKYRRFWQHAN